MPVIRISGLPKEHTSQKQLRSLRLYLRKSYVEQYWINEIADTRGTDFKEAGIEVGTNDDAYTMESYINKVPYRRNGMPHFLKFEYIRFDYEDSGRSRSRSRVSHQHDYDYHPRECSYERYSPKRFPERYRSRSPINRLKSDLDVEFEYLRKKRELIEEETRLIKERKKLELIREFGVSVFNGLENHERSRDREMRPKRVERQRERAPPQAAQADIPLFVMPCRRICRELRPLINKATESSKHERPNLIKLIRSNLRRTFALALEGRKYMPTSEILAVYRELHPVQGDKEFVNTMLDNLRSSFWPVKKPKKSKPPKKTQEDKNKTGSPAATVVKQEPKEKIEPVIKKEVDAEASVNDEKSSDAVDSAETTAKSTNTIKVETPNVTDETVVEDVTDETVVEDVTDETVVEDVTDETVVEDVPDKAETCEETVKLEPSVEEDEVTSEITVNEVDDKEDQFESSEIDVFDEDDWVTNGIDWVEDGST